MTDNIIRVRGARQHNLKNVDLDLPKDKFIVFSGLSGSGKSSLAFDTIYAEGQRRYVESLSSYARQFLGVMTKPDVDRIEGLSPAISIDQKTTSHNPRSTVGTITEIYDYFRLLYARIGHPHCPICGTEIAPQSAQLIVNQVITQIDTILKTNPTAKFLILAPVVQDKKGSYENLLTNLMRQGFIRARVDGRIIKLDEPINLLKNNKHTIEAVIDRISFDRQQWKDEVSKSNFKSRLTQGIEQSLQLADGLTVISIVNDAGFEIPDNPKQTQDHLFSERYACPECNLSLSDLEPRSFSFNSPQGACPECTGLGTQLKVDPSLIFAPKLSIVEGGILPYATMFEHMTWFARTIAEVCKTHNINIKKPIADLTSQEIALLLEGTGDQIYHVTGTNREGKTVTITDTFKGLIAEIEKRYAQTESEWVRDEIEKYLRQIVCPACLGQRLKPESLAVTIDQKNIAQVTSLPITQAYSWAQNIDPVLSQREQAISLPILTEIKARLQFLNSVGLEYLTLNRTAATLAGGEAQRIRLASQIGSGLTGVLYVLDEPSIGLHPRDTHRLISSLKYLRDLGNTVIVVEHDQDTIETADWVVDFGPAAGKFGGQVTAQGTVDEIKKNPKSLTGQYISGKKKIQITVPNDRQPPKKFFTIHGCSQHNLKNIDVPFPYSKFIGVTGVSGSGKSTLVVETLYHALANHLNPYHPKPANFQNLSNVDDIHKVVLIDQAPIGRTPRSNPATYTGLFTPIRELFATSPEAKIRGYNPGRFSFNVKGGRCETCEGGGTIKIEMQFLADLYITCDTCHGTRYNDETLQVEFRGKNIAEVLKMTVDDASEFFHNIPFIRNKLATLQEVGLGYIELGQSATTLSGGEAQRVKLATELSKRSTTHTVYILDEPTTGLHFADLEKLLNVLHALVNKDNTVIVIEHNLDVIKSADWIVDLGPEGGEGGGYLVATGSPKDIVSNPNSETGEWLIKAGL